MTKIARIKMVFCVAVTSALVLVFYHKFRVYKANKDIHSAAGRAAVIFDALSAFAHDNDSYFPSRGQSATSNEALGVLFSNGLIYDDLIFCVARSKWSSLEIPVHSKSPQAEEYQLYPGRNHWAYNADLSLNTPVSKVLLCDGFCDQRVFWYSKQQTEYGGTWNGEKFIHMTVSGAVKIVPINEQPGAYVNVEALADFVGGTLLNPAKVSK